MNDYLKLVVLGLIALAAAIAANYARDLAYNVHALLIMVIAGGAFVFDRLPAGVYQVVETQPASVFDRNETAGTAGGDVNNG